MPRTNIVPSCTQTAHRTIIAGNAIRYYAATSTTRSRKIVPIDAHGTSILIAAGHTVCYLAFSADLIEEVVCGGAKGAGCAIGASLAVRHG